MKKLRDYQGSAVQSVFDWFGAHKPEESTMIVAPVGAGKSLINAAIIQRIHADAPRTRIICLTHVQELLEQNAGELQEYTPNADWGFYCAGLGQKRLYNDITFASIQSIRNKLQYINRAPQVILIDECHLISHDEQTTYRQFIEACRNLNPNLVVIGLTGTPFRADSGRLDEGDNALFTGVAYEISIAWMIEQGYLVKPSSPRTSIKLSVEGVGTRGGDYIASQLEKAVDIHETTMACVRETIEKSAGRRKWLCFTAGLQHCQHVRDAFRMNGVSAEMITSETPKGERADIIKRFNQGEFTCLVNVAVLTTGFNVPSIDNVIFMRPTRSPVLYIQCVGRGIRPVYASGYDLETQQGRLDAIANSIKPDCQLLDFGGVVEALGPVDTIDIRKAPKKKEENAEPGEAIMKRCPSCGTMCYAAQKYCYHCSYDFASAALNKTASTAAVVSSDIEPQEWKVISVEYELYNSKENRAAIAAGKIPPKPPTMKANYITLGGHFAEYVCFNHSGYARENAVHWHKQRFPDRPPPANVEEALWMGYPCPSRITVKKEGQFWRVVKCEFDPEDAGRENKVEWFDEKTVQVKPLAKGEKANPVYDDIPFEVTPSDNYTTTGEWIDPDEIPF